MKNDKEWKGYCKSGKLPDDIPAKPSDVYKGKGWIGLGDWLGTGTLAPWLREYRSFEQARKFVHELRLTGNKEWRRYCRGKFPEKEKLPKEYSISP